MSHRNDDNDYRPGACPLDPGPVETRQHWQIIQDLRIERDKARAERDALAAGHVPLAGFLLLLQRWKGRAERSRVSERDQEADEFVRGMFSGHAAALEKVIIEARKLQSGHANSAPKPERLCDGCSGNDWRYMGCYATTGAGAFQHGWQCLSCGNSHFEALVLPEPKEGPGK